MRLSWTRLVPWVFIGCDEAMSNECVTVPDISDPAESLDLLSNTYG